MTKTPPETPKQPIDPKDKNRYDTAVQEGRTILTGGGSKADAARAIFRLIHSEPREVVLRAFIEGADVTPNPTATTLSRTQHDPKQQSPHPYRQPPHQYNYLQ